MAWYGTDLDDSNDSDDDIDGYDSDITVENWHEPSYGYDGQYL